jgi:hypothetical protein
MTLVSLYPGHDMIQISLFPSNVMTLVLLKPDHNDTILSLSWHSGMTRISIHLSNLSFFWPRYLLTFSLHGPKMPNPCVFGHYWVSCLTLILSPCCILIPGIHHHNLDTPWHWDPFTLVNHFNLLGPSPSWLQSSLILTLSHPYYSMIIAGNIDTDDNLLPVLLTRVNSLSPLLLTPAINTKLQISPREFS